MMSEKWVVSEKRGRGQDEFWVQTASGTELVAVVTRKADARLIAASPALAEALEDVRDNLVAWFEAEWELPGHEQLIDRVLATLNLAKGRTT